MVETPGPVFAALGDETRWRILVRLAEQPASASRLAPDLPISRQAIVKHLEVLRSVGLVEVEQRGREMVYAPVGARLSALARELERIGHAWDARLLQIKALAEDTEITPDRAGRPAGPGTQTTPPADRRATPRGGRGATAG